MPARSATATVSAREVYQLFRDVALQQSALMRDDGPRWAEIDTGVVHVCIDGRRIALFKDAGELHHCLGCELEDGRVAGQDSWRGAGTDPLELLSVWERAQLLKALERL
ncbi:MULTISPECIES: hypothetical protein [Pseudomonadaceae]|uniref:DUF7693 family protein n=1 Tax=Pseudomonadaceae TaxID=135621 RepID=UPI001D194DA0|nr:hypothetical protein [Halopseudomonas aestusnigri]MCC4260765.1 hypothetical protein [Halopseudomonas aestusnigri]MCK5533181.1 hypothetical protein [Halopseudomonas aestusnigri]